jgi:hypothetical protein
MGCGVGLSRGQAKWWINRSILRSSLLRTWRGTGTTTLSDVLSLGYDSSNQSVRVMPQKLVFHSISLPHRLVLTLRLSASRS